MSLLLPPSSLVSSFFVFFVPSPSFFLHPSLSYANSFFCLLIVIIYCSFIFSSSFHLSSSSSFACLFLPHLVHNPRLLLHPVLVLLLIMFLLYILILLHLIRLLLVTQEQPKQKTKKRTCGEKGKTSFPPGRTRGRGHLGPRLFKVSLSAPKSQRFLRFAIAMPIADPRNRSDFRDKRKAMLHCDLRVRWKVASDLRFRAAISERKTPSFCGISGDLAPSTRKSLAIAIVRFWCAMFMSHFIFTGFVRLR